MAIFTGILILDLLGLITALVAISWGYLKWTYTYWERRGLPYLEPTIPFGNVENPFRRTISMADKFVDMYKEAKSKGWKHFGIYLMASPMYFVADLDILKHIMAKDFQYFVDRGVYTNEKDNPIGCHLFALGGKKWRNLRVKLTPTFTSGKLKAMFQTLVDCGLLLEECIEEHIDSKKSVDIKNVLGCFTTDVIGSCAFGIECNSFKEPNSLFREYATKFLRITKLQSLRNLVSSNFPNLARACGLPSVSKEVSDFYTKVVEDTVAYREKNNYNRKDFLQLLIDLKNKRETKENGQEGGEEPLTMNEIVAQSFVFFIAGFETSSTTMTFALFELATHPELQYKVKSEIKTVLEKYNNQITYDSVNEMKYMGQVIDETLRLYPPVAVLTRMCGEDYKVPGEDIVIEKGTRVGIPVKGIHHDEDYYENPEVFDPERFTEENKKTRHPFAHIPFGEGPRICIEMDLRDRLVKNYFSLGLQQKEIIALIETVHNVTIHPRTLKRILNKLKLFRRKNYSNLESVVNFIDGQLNKSGQMHGYRWMHLKCIQHGYTITQDIVREILLLLDPHGVDIRKRKRLRRRQYNNKGPNSVWHMDSYDKLKQYGICINGGIDGYSRYVLWLRAGRTSNDPKVIAGYYLNALKKFGGCPQTVRSDMGTENGTVEKIQTSLREVFAMEEIIQRAPFIYGRSTANQRIESWWSILRKQNAQYWINLFEILKDEGLFNGTFLDKSLIQFCFLKIIQDELNEVVFEWNTHKIRSSRNCRSPIGRPDIMFEAPELYGVENCLIQLSQNIMNCVEEECTFYSNSCDEEIAQLCQEIISDLNYDPINDPYDAVQLYINIRTQIYDMMLSNE